MGSPTQHLFYIDDWLPEYGQPNRIPARGDGGDDDRDHAPAVLIEDHEARGWLPHQGTEPGLDLPSMAFVDGVRRAEGFLFAPETASGRQARGLVGAYAWGAVLAVRGERPRFESCQVERVAIWGSSHDAEIPPHPGGWRWRTHSIEGHEVHEPLRELEKRMRMNEGALADELASKAFLTIVDGPLEFVTRQKGEVVGYVKTHHRQLLADAEHKRVPTLALGYRTSLFAIRDDLLSAYVRMGMPSPVGNPWTGIARIEVPRALGLTRAVEMANTVTGALPRFAGVPHRDPRAPQNLQPVGALETHLRRLLGSEALARRATRDALASASRGASPGRGAAPSGGATS